MKTQIDIKSALIGLFAGIAAVLAIGASSSTPHPLGRYQIGGTASHAFVIDTATGQVWSKFTPQQSGETSGEFAKPKLGDQK